jgi:hypothetical protein
MQVVPVGHPEAGQLPVTQAGSLPLFGNIQGGSEQTVLQGG